MRYRHQEGQVSQVLVLAHRVILVVIIGQLLEHPDPVDEQKGSPDRHLVIVEPLERINGRLKQSMLRIQIGQHYF